MSRIGVILGSTRPNRNGEQVARWVLEIASRRSDTEFELADLRDFPLPHLDEPLPPSLGRHQNVRVFKPAEYNQAALSTLLDQVIAWSTALAPLRQPALAAAA